MLVASHVPGTIIAHPPGYPTFTTIYFYGSMLLQSFWTNATHVAQYWHGVSAILGALTAFVLFHALVLCYDLIFLLYDDRRGTEESNPSSSLFSFRIVFPMLFTLTYSIGIPSIVEYNRVTEVFALHHFFLALLTYLFIKWKYHDGYSGKMVIENQKHQMEKTAAAVYGNIYSQITVFVITAALSLTNQHSSTLYIGVLGSLMMWDVLSKNIHQQKETAKGKNLKHEGGSIIIVIRSFVVFLFSMFLLATLVMIFPYWWVLFYLPCHESRQQHAFSWGETNTVSGFFQHIFRSDYGTFQLHAGYGLMTDGPHGYAVSLMAQSWSQLQWTWSQSPLLLFLTAFGVISQLLFSSFSKNRSSLRHLIFSFLLLILFPSLVFSLLANIPLHLSIYQHVYHRFWMQHFMPLLFLGFTLLMSTLTPFLIPPTTDSAHEGGRKGEKRKARSLLERQVPIFFFLVLLSTTIINVKNLHGQLTSPHRREMERIIDHFATSALKGIAGEMTEKSEKMQKKEQEEGAPILITSGDVYVTSLRFKLFLHPPGRTACRSNFRSCQQKMTTCPPVIHVDRELFWYSWCKKRLMFHYPEVHWPGELMKGLHSDAKDGSNTFTNVALIARDNLRSSISEIKKTESKSRNNYSLHRLFVLETSDIAKEEPNFKTYFRATASGWFYEVRSKDAALGKQLEECPANFRVSSFIDNSGSAISLDWTDIEVVKRFILFYIQRECNTPSLFDFRKLVPAYIREEMSYVEVNEEFPWEASLLEAFHLAEKNMLLNVAIVLQTCFGSTVPATKHAALISFQTLENVAKLKLKAKYFQKHNYQVTVVPFLKLMKEMILQLEHPS